MTIEAKGPGGVGNNYGTRSNTQPSGIDSTLNKTVYNEFGPYQGVTFNGTSLVSGDGTTLIPVVGGLSTTNSAAAATANTAAIQAALTAGGLVQILAPGAYLVTLLTMPSNTSLYLGAGVELKATGGASAILTNSAARANGTVIGAGEMTWTAAGPNFAATITKTGIHLLHPVGSHVAIVGAASRGYNGVWEVISSVVGAITFRINKTPIGAVSPAVAATITSTPTGMRVIAADVNIGVYGPGTLNGDGANNTTFASGDPRGNVVWFRNAAWVTIDGLALKGGATWTIGSNNLAYYRVQNLRGDMRWTGQTSGDCVHLSGTHRDVRISNLDVSTTDNPIGLTIDITTSTAFDFPFQSPGDMTDIVINNINAISPTVGLIGIYGPAAYRYNNITIDGVTGECSTNVQVANYTPTAMNNCQGDVLTMRNLMARTSGNVVSFNSVQNWDQVTLDGAFYTAAGSPAVCAFTHTGNIKKVSLRNMVCDAALTAKSGAWVTVSTGPIGTIEVSDCVVTGGLGAAVPFMEHTGVATIGRVILNNIQAANASSGASGIFKSTGAGAIGSVSFNNCLWAGVTQSGYMCDLGATSAVTTVTFNQCRVETAGGLMSTANTTPSIEVLMNNVTLGSLCARAATFAGPTNLYVNGYSELVAPSNNPFQCVTAAKLYNFKMENVGRDSDSIQKTGGTLRLHGGGARTAIANVDAPQAGDMVYNITGTVRVARNIANSAWVNLHT